MKDLQGIERFVIEQAAKAASLSEIAVLRAQVLGKTGELGQALRELGSLPAAERRQAGETINVLKKRVEDLLALATKRVETELAEQKLLQGRVDVTLPGRRLPPGNPHPLRLLQEAVQQTLIPLGFQVVEGPLLEYDWFNFGALNIPLDHPARDMQDTFFLSEQVLLRTHTSNVQIRTMLTQKPPLKILAPGMVFRRDEVDPTHSPVFHQLEGLWVTEKATFADLKGVLHKLVNGLFGPEVQLRFRPSYFPFTEPSLEVDISCIMCQGQQAYLVPNQHDHERCRVCGDNGWLEILGAGMVHPAVLQAVGYDPDKLQGFAFGIGLERLAMLRFAIDDIRLFYENDLRFLQQFAVKNSW